MTIDWFTVVAQILNFLILVWLLKRFLYLPILDAIDAREQRIAAELTHAATIQSDAQKQRDEFARKNTEFEQQKHLLMQEANKAADVERARLIAQARDQADALAAKHLQALEREQHDLQGQLRHLASEEVFAIARKALTELAGASLDESIIATFIGRLQTMGANAKQAFSNILSDLNATSENAETLLVCSAFELAPQQKIAIQLTLNKTLSADIPLKFETNPKVISGIRLSAHGQQISWCIEDYLASLEKSLEHLLQAVSDKKPSVCLSEIPMPEISKPLAASTNAPAPQ